MKGEISEKTELQNQEIIRIRGEDENYKYLEILEADTIKLAEMKEKSKKIFQKYFIAWLELELTDYDDAVWDISNYAPRDTPMF